MTYVFYSKIAPVGIYYDDQGNRVKIKKGNYEENDVLAPAQPTPPPAANSDRDFHAHYWKAIGKQKANPQALWDRIAVALESIAKAVEKITR